MKESRGAAKDSSSGRDVAIICFDSGTQRYLSIVSIASKSSKMLIRMASKILELSHYDSAFELFVKR